MKRAIFLGIVKVKDEVDARIFYVEPPLDGYSYVRVSARSFEDFNRECSLENQMPPETFIFGCDCSGHIENWHELNGSCKGTMSHAVALRNAGYEIVSSIEELDDQIGL